ncbi:MAG: hypothetical protein KDE27_05425 [Planctomycetes bacterium]|nr:hypothetical protein [Planctomycetota bacterium]
MIAQTTEALSGLSSLAAGGAALLVAGILVYVLSHLSKEGTKRDEALTKVVDRMSEQSDKRDAVIDRLADRFAATATTTAQSFEQTATTIHREMRESSERRERELHQLVRQVAGLPKEETPR